MNFISNLYSKVAPKMGSSASVPHETQRKSMALTSDHSRSQTVTMTHTTVVEESYDLDDGFVVYSNTQPAKKCRTAEIKWQDRMERICYQQHSPSNICSTVEKSFITVSDVPMVISKPFQAAFNLNLRPDSGTSAMSKIDQYDYDFSLERSVLSTIDSYMKS